MKKWLTPPKLSSVSIVVLAKQCFALLLVVACPRPEALALPWQLESGIQSSLPTQRREAVRSLIYVEPSKTWGLEDMFTSTDGSTPWSVKARLSCRLQIDFAEDSRREFRRQGHRVVQGAQEVNLREGTLSLSRGHSRSVLGWQQVSWGETFGFSVLDIVNGRDLRDPLRLDGSWTRQSTFLIQQQLFLNSLTLQLLLAPLPSSHLLPRTGSAYADAFSSAAFLSESAVTRSGVEPREAEFGGRISHLFDSGLDLGLLFYEHYNRNVVYFPALSSPSGLPMELRPYAKRVKSLGSSLSYSWNEFVFRGDGVVHIGQPLQSPAGVVIDDTTHSRAVLGVDWMSAETVLGVQYHLDDHGENHADLARASHWLSVQVRQDRLVLDRLNVSFFLYRGLGNQDLWLQPKATVSFGEHTEVSLLWDHLKSTRSALGVSSGSLDVLENFDRALGLLTVKF